MKIPGLGKIATFALNHIVLPAIGRAIADGKNPLTKEAAKAALEKAVVERAVVYEARRRIRT